MPLDLLSNKTKMMPFDSLSNDAICGFVEK
jgi:hypothetical protein